MPEPPMLPVKLVEFDLQRGLQKPQLYQQLSGHGGRVRNLEERRKQIRQINIKRSQGGYELLNYRRTGVSQIHLTIRLLAQRIPVQLYKGMFLGNFAHYLIRNVRAFSKAGQMKLPHFSAAAHVVHQIKRVSLPADKSHTSPQATTSAVV
jgi:hypothetical protein